MSTRKIDTPTQFTDLIESGDLGFGALVRENTAPGVHWIVYDTEDGPYALRPCNEDDLTDQRRTARPVLVEFTADSFDLPLYVTTEEI